MKVEYFSNIKDYLNFPLDLKSKNDLLINEVNDLKEELKLVKNKQNNKNYESYYFFSYKYYIFFIFLKKRFKKRK